MDENLPPNPPLNEGSNPATPDHTSQTQPAANPASAPTPAEPPPITASTTSQVPPRKEPAPPPLTNPPPPFQRPPPLVAATPSPGPRSRCGLWKVLALLLFLALAASVVLNMKHYARRLTAGKTVHHKKQVLEEVVIEDNKSRHKIAVVEIEGVISSGDSDRRGHSLVDSVREQLDAAAEDDAVKAVLLKVNSPGGEVLASDEIHNAIRDFQDDTGKPVIASMQTLAASGGYYVSAPCRWIVANELTLTGSIGVIMHGWNVSGLMDKIGVRAETYKSGAHKDMLSPFRHPDEISPEEQKMMRGLIMETYGKFTNIVVTGRSEAWKANAKLKEQGKQLEENWSDFADGRVLSGNQAYDLGLVDELGDFDAAVQRAEVVSRIGNANLIQYQQPFDIGELFSLFGQTQTRSLKVDLGVEFPKMQRGCLYFLYPNAVP